jgi:hypothetical protein
MKIAGGKSRRGQRVLVHPAAEKKPTKLSRLAPRDTIVGTVEDLERAREELDDDMRTRWGTKALGDIEQTHV